MSYTGQSRTTLWRNKKNPERKRRDFQPTEIVGWNATGKDLATALKLANQAVYQIGLPRLAVEDAAQEILIAWAQGRSWLTGAWKAKYSYRGGEDKRRWQLSEKELVVAIDLRAKGINSMEELVEYALAGGR